MPCEQNCLSGPNCESGPHPRAKRLSNRTKHSVKGHIYRNTYTWSASHSDLTLTIGMPDQHWPRAQQGTGQEGDPPISLIGCRPTACRRGHNATGARQPLHGEQGLVHDAEQVIKAPTGAAALLLPRLSRLPLSGCNKVFLMHDGWLHCCHWCCQVWVVVQHLVKHEVPHVLLRQLRILKVKLKGSCRQAGMKGRPHTVKRSCLSGPGTLQHRRCETSRQTAACLTD